MLNRFRHRIGYANVMATVAVFIALGGGAYATHTHKLGTKDLRAGAVTTPKLKGSAVKRAKIANRAVAPAKLAPAARGVRGYALVAGNGFVNDDEQRGGVEATSPDTGVYCFGLNFEPQVVVASPETGPPRIVQTFHTGSTIDCPPGFRDAEVRLHEVGGPPADGGFYVLFN